MLPGFFRDEGEDRRGIVVFFEPAQKSAGGAAGIEPFKFCLYEAGFSFAHILQPDDHGDFLALHRDFRVEFQASDIYLGFVQYVDSDFLGLVDLQGLGFVRSGDPEREFVGLHFGIAPEQQLERKVFRTSGFQLFQETDVIFQGNDG